MPHGEHEDSLYEAAASELLRALRGKRSQRGLARRLGYRSNVCTDWENGRRYPTAPETLRVAALLRRDLAGVFSPFLPAPPPSRAKGYAVAEWLGALRGTTSLADLARRAARSRFSVSRWLSGESVPRLPDFLRLVDAVTGRAADWVAGLVDIALVPSFAASYLRVSAARRVSLELPWSEAVLRVIETVGYAARPRHSDAYIAETLGIDRALVADVITALEQAQVIACEGSRFAVVGALLVDTKSAEPAGDARRRHWAEVARSRILNGRNDWFAYNVISVSRADSARIERVLRAAFREIRGIVRDSEPCEEAALLTLQLSRWATEG